MIPMYMIYRYNKQSRRTKFLITTKTIMVSFVVYTYFAFQFSMKPNRYEVQNYI